MTEVSQIALQSSATVAVTLQPTFKIKNSTLNKSDIIEYSVIK